MINLLLIIALALAIILDCVRIIQYIAWRKRLDEKNKADIADKIDSKYEEWISKAHYEHSLGHYCMEHWNDEK